MSDRYRFKLRSYKVFIIRCLAVTILQPKHSPAGRAEFEKARKATSEQTVAWYDLVMTKILVVEDIADTAALMKSILELSGFKVVLGFDGVDGIEQARAESPDLIITDIAMPRLNGIEMIQQLRGMPEFKTTPILAITSHGMDKAMEALKAGASRALARPIQNHLLLVFVFDLLRK